ncbi:chromosome transmission fidelity protein 18 homolog [Diadema antillarum]|uniref:chromosome transmission fidelity protein 18 homolog n=1 Tax=Diadema antillarum TaxID=105358 RepID=UPI003A87728B
MDPALEAEFQDDFEDRFADELDALRDLEDEVENTQGIASKPKPSSQLSAVNSQSQRNENPKPASNDAKTDGSLSGRSSRKRDMYEMFGIMSDSESDGELVIDAPSPIKDPDPKRPRKTLLDKFRDNALERRGEKNLRDLEITPPPTPDKGRGDGTLPSRAGGKRSLRVLTRQPEGESVKVTGQDGQRVFLKMKLEDDTWKNGKKFVSKYSTNHTKGLLTSSYDTLIRQIDDENRRKVIEESTRVSEKLRRELAKEYEDEESDELVVGKAQEDDGKENRGLWVDKYAPRHYTDLLSDDGVNRNLLFWLKLWDYVVFGKELKQPKTKGKHEGGIKGVGQQPNKFKSKFQPEELTVELDEQKRPRLKVALLCGPPGLGKTTLAHVIARHAGYNVIEMNASDDRSQEIFKTRLLSTIQMTSVLAPDQRPNCLVIDEIDGAPQPAINCLINIIKAGSDGNQGGKKKKAQPPLKRPIICICNDVYVPALRQLRQLAYVTHFPPTVSARLAHRMYVISKRNQLQTDLTTLMALCTKAENDIRSCLNTLQFLQQQGKPVTLSLVHSLTVGQKDQHKSLFSVWQQLFQLPKPKKKQYTNPHDLKQGGRLGASLDSMQGLDGDMTSPTARFHHMLHVIQASGEHEKLMQGVFENYLDVKFKDPHMDAINAACDWLVFSDKVQTKIATTQNYTFGRFLPFVPLTFHMLFACVAYTKIRYPNTQYEVKTKREHISNLVDTMCAESTPHVRRGMNLTLAVTEILPPLLIILRPAFRPINTQLFSVSEKKQLKELVDTMIAYNLTYRQERSAEGTYNYNLDPNLEVVTRFSDSPPVRPITYAAKQLIAREIDLEKMRRSEAALETKSEGSKTSGLPVQKPVNAKDKNPDTAVPRHKQKLQAKKIDVEEEEKPMRDFFGRIIQVPAGTGDGQGNETNQNKRQKQPAKRRPNKQLWYNFNTGYTNAVRKHIKIQELL